MERKAQEQLQSIKQTILDHIDAEAIYLFGSFAYGTSTEKSDFDLYVIIPDFSIRPVEAAKIINNAIYENQRRPVDVLVSKSSDFARRAKLPTIERTIAEKGILLHGR